MITSTLSIPVFVLAFCTGFMIPDHPKLKKVDQLQMTARAANGGALGCGIGTATLVTSKGDITLMIGLDPIHVFGKRIKISDIHVL